MSPRIRIIVGVVVVAIVATTAWLWATSGRESTDDAQVDAHITPIAGRVGGTVLRVPVAENQQVEVGTVLLEIDTRDYQVALDRARAELATAEAEALAANANVPITSTSTSSQVSTARGGIEQAEASVAEAEHSLESARARVKSSEARLRELEATSAKDARDVERLSGLLAKDEIPQQQFDAAAAQAVSSRAAADAARGQLEEARLGIRVAESRLQQERAKVQQATAELRAAQTAPEQVAVTRARASSAAARVKQAQTAVKQAELNLDYATVKAPVKGVVSKRTAEVGQVIQPGQPLMTITPLEQVWITANFKETQLEDMRPGQSVKVNVDAYGGLVFTGKVDSIAPATGSKFSLLPPENATGNFVKVVQRVPVKIILDSGQDPNHLLRPGMSVTPTVYTK